MSTVQEIKDAIQTLSAAELAEIEDWFREQHPRLDPEVDSPELEVELLKRVVSAAFGPQGTSASLRTHIPKPASAISVSLSDAMGGWTCCATPRLPTA
jgi:hypothetical protein